MINLHELSYKAIKEYVDSIDIFDKSKKNEIDLLINELTNDKRKNVSTLGNKISKDIKKLEDEINRVKVMYNFDKAFNKRYLAGVDEVGRGPLAGPIVSCAVILDLEALDDELILYLNDSKKINEAKRIELAEIIKEKAISYNIAECSNEEIDKLGIAYCNNDIFIRAIKGLNIKPDIVLSDGYLVKGLGIENKAVIKGDAKSASIAAASILAKVYRDTLMKELHKKYDKYDFDSNVGYGAPKHLEGLKKYGPCSIHRMSFLKNILNRF